MQTILIFQNLGISLMLGLLVGLQRQHVHAPLGGIRTFPLVTVFGRLRSPRRYLWRLDRRCRTCRSRRDNRRRKNNDYQLAAMITRG